MATVTSVGITSGVPSSGTGNVSTIDQLIAVGSPISNGSTSAPVIVNISGASSAVTSSMSALNVALSPNSAGVTISSGTITSISSIASIGSVSSVGVIGSIASISSGTLASVTSLSSGVVAIANGSNVANVIAGSSAVTSTMAALVVALSSNGYSPTISTITSVSSGSFAIINGANTVAVAGASSSATSSMSALVVAISPNSVNPNGGTTSSQSAPTVPADQYGAYAVVGASLTQQSLGSSAGRAGDYLAYVTVFPTVAASGAVTIFDSTGVTIGSFAGGGTTALPSLIPFRIDIGAYSISSGWKITTSSNVSALGVGKFT